MAVDVKRILEKDDKGVVRQIYPVTHVSAVEGLEEFSNGEIPLIPLASENQDGLMPATVYKQLKELEELKKNTITFERIDTV